MPDANPDEPTAWEVTLLDRADADIKENYEFLRPFVGDDKAEQWSRDLFLTLFSLPDFPGPFAHPIDEAASRFTGRSMRKMLFRGGTRQKPIGTTYRVYFYIIEQDNVSERGEIFILRVLHGATEAWPAPE